MKLHCWLHGHDDLPFFEEVDNKRNMRLECQNCGRLTPGWHHERKQEGSFLERLNQALSLIMPIVLAGIIWTGPKLTPQEAADVLRPNQFTAPPTCDDCYGPTVTVGTDSTDPWGAFRLGWAFHRVVGVPIYGGTSGSSRSYAARPWFMDARTSKSSIRTPR